MNLLSGETAPEIYGNPNALGRPSTSLQQLSPRHTMVPSACGGGGRVAIKSDVCYDDRGMTSQAMGLDACGVQDMNDDTYGALQVKKSPPSNGKKTKGRVKIKMEYIENKLRRYTTFSKRKTGIMKKAYELSTLTGTQVMLLVASETGHVYTFATRKLQPMITSEAGKALIQTCLNSPDPPGGASGGDQRMSATGFEETELTYNISDDDSKDENMSTVDSSGDSSDGECGDQEQELRISTTTSPIIAQSSKPTASQTVTSSGQNRTLSSSTSSSRTTSSTSVTPSSEGRSTSTNTPVQGSSTVSSLGSAGGGGGGGSSNGNKTNGTSTSSSSTVTTTPIISPLLYQTPQGVMYATPSSNGMIFSLANSGDPTLGQFITIPLSLMAAANGQGELDLSKRK